MEGYSWHWQESSDRLAFDSRGVPDRRSGVCFRLWTCRSRAYRASKWRVSDAPAIHALFAFIQPRKMQSSRVKVFHIVFVVSWMAGLFYLPRLFLYHAESLGVVWRFQRSAHARAGARCVAGDLQGAHQKERKNLSTLGTVLVCTMLTVGIGFREYPASRRRTGEMAAGAGGARET